jgi:hypothetical protein
MPASHGDGTHGRVMFISAGAGAATQKNIFTNYLQKYMIKNENYWGVINVAMVALVTEKKWAEISWLE